MGLFDPRIFDPQIFDTGEEVSEGPGQVVPIDIDVQAKSSEFGITAELGVINISVTNKGPISWTIEVDTIDVL